MTIDGKKFALCIIMTDVLMANIFFLSFMNNSKDNRIRLKKNSLKQKEASACSSPISLV